MSLAVKTLGDFNSIKIHPWVLQVTFHLPSAWFKWSYKPPWDFGRKHRQTLTDSMQRSPLGFAEVHGHSAAVAPRSTAVPAACPQHRTGSVEAANTQLPREPASQPDAPAGKLVCVPTASGTAGLWSPSRERRVWGEEGHFITQHER